LRRYIADMNPTVRGFLVIALIALVIVVLQLQATLVSLYLLARIAFFLAIAFVAYLFWRERRSDIETWPTRAQVAFYGGAAIIVVALGVYFWPGRATQGLDLVAFLVTLGIAGFAMFRTWRDQHSFT
jgi:small-conductance mechanosensitive channel